MAGNEVTIVVKGRNDSGAAVAEADKQMAELSKKTEFFAKKTAEAKAKVDELMASLLAVGDDGSLSVDEVTDAERRLVAELQKAQRELAGFQKLGKQAAEEIADALKDAAEEAAAAALQQGMHAGEMFTDGMLSSFSAATPALIGGLAAVAVMATPTLGAMIGGAVLGGAGAGGMIGGIVLAARDPRVKAAGAEFAENAIGSLDRLGDSFVDPVVGSLGRLDDKIESISTGPLLVAFQSLSREVAPFTLNLERAADKFIPGFTRALKAAEPVLRTLGNELPGLAADITAMFDAMSEDPDGAVMGMKKLLDVTGDVLVVFGELIGWLEQTYEGGVAVGLVVSTAFENWFHWLGIIMPPFELLARYVGVFRDDLEGQAEALDRANQPAAQFGTNLEGIGTAAEDAAEQMDLLTRAIDTLFGKQMSVDQATIRWHEGLIDLRKELAEGTKTLSLYSEEGLKNRDVLAQMIGDAHALREATAKQTGDVEAANAAYQKNIRALYDMAAAAGFSKKELDAMFGPYFDGDKEAIMRFSFPGLAEGVDLAEQLARLTGGGPRTGVTGWSDLREAERYFAGDRKAAGGPSSGGLTMMHEQGWEMVKLPNGAHVIPHGASETMLAGGSSAQAVNLTVQLTLEGRVIREISIEDALSRGVDPVTVAGAYP